MTEMLETYRGAVYPWHCDHMGHMNVMWYVGKFDEATWNLFGAIGLSAAFLKEQRRGMAAVREKLAKFVHETRNGAGEISAICVLTALRAYELPV